MAQIDASIYNLQKPPASPLKGIEEGMAVRAQQQNAELNQLKLDDAKQARDLRSELSRAITQTPMVDEDGVSVYDIAGIAKNLGPAYQGNADEVVKHLGGINSAFRAEQAAKKAIITQGATALIASGSDPDLTLHFIDTLEKRGSYPKETLDTFREFIKAHPDKTAAILQQFVPAQKLENAAPGSSARNPLTGQIIPGSEVPASPTIANLAVKAAQGDEQAIAALKLARPGAEKSLVPDDVLIDGKLGKAVFHPDTGKYTRPGTDDDISDRVKPYIKPTGSTINIAAPLTDAALDQAAQKYIATGTLPAVGMGAAGMAQRAKIMNRAAELDPSAALARNAAIYKADSANLSNLQRIEGSLSAFEKTAGRNLDQFLALADKIPDTGIPWLNTPVRRLTVNVVGQANMAAVNAAREVALREIARVTNDPRLSGQLTDTARREVQGLSPENATLPQIRAVAKVLKQDMENVHKSLNEEIEGIKRGLGSSGSTPSTTDPMGIR